MIPINKRINEEEKKQYIVKVLNHITRTNVKSFRDAVNFLIEKLETDKALYDNIQNEISSWEQILKDEKMTISIDSNNMPLSSDFANICAWLVMPYELMREIYIKVNAFDKETTDKLIQKFELCKKRYINTFSKYGINRWIVKTTEIKVCPYCNLAYAYNRTSKAATAQLDHFYNKSDYPMFALCYYNLIPSCYACNHIKSDSNMELVSPYADNAFEKMEISWTLQPQTNKQDNLLKLEENISIQIKSKVPAENNNLKEMNIVEAYQNHKDYAAEVVKKIMIYNNPHTKELIRAGFKQETITDEEIERLYFGNYMNKKDQGKRILSKLASDFYNSTKKHP